MKHIFKNKIIFSIIFLLAVGAVFFTAQNYFKVDEISAAGTYPEIPLPASGDTYSITFSAFILNAAPANLDGDDKADWLAIFSPQNGIDGQLTIEARNYSGGLLWTKKTGILDRHTQDCSGMHEAVIAWNFNNQNVWDEVVYVGIVNDQPYVYMLDGKTGAQLKRVDFPLYNGTSGTNCDGRTSSSYPPGIGNHYATVAYLDGPNGDPYFVVSKGTYANGYAVAYDKNLNVKWIYQHTGSGNRSTGAHELRAHDLDGDGREEILYGGTIISPEGKKIWSLSDQNLGHVDMVEPGDLRPDIPGLEIFFGVENGGAALMVKAMTGEVIWRVDDGTCNHVHTGFCCDYDASKLGDEVVARSKDQDCMGALNGKIDAYGNIGEEFTWAQLATRPPEWTGDEYYELDPVITRSITYAADVGGGPNHGAEEIINYYQSKTIKVRFNLNAKSYPSRWQNRHYNQDVRRVLSGYTFRTSTFRTIGSDLNSGFQFQTCHTYTNTSSVPAGFGASWNTLTSAKEMLMKANCGDTATSFEIGNGNQITYIYKNGYVYKDNKWNPITYTGTPVTGSDFWLKGTANYTLSNSLTSGYFAAYVCQYINNAWKCGCRDSACATPYWQLQKWTK